MSAIETIGKGVTYVNVNNKNTRMTLITSFWCFIVNFELISHLFLVFLLLTLNRYLFAGVGLW